MKLYPNLEKYIDGLKQGLDQIANERQELLQTIAEYVRSTSTPKLNFICTHNSRRSHLGQVWAQAAATYYGKALTSYSGGTEATAFHPNAISALQRAGFDITKGQGSNPKYEVGFSKEADPMICFSKKYDDEVNPSENFAAIMTCSEADAECPFIPGASSRIKLLYEDPKVADNTPQQDKKYDERCKQIAIEMFYVFSKIK